MANGDDRFTGLLGNPMFTVGMNMLAGNQQGDPWGGVLSGLQSAQQFQTEAEKKEREDQLRRELQQYLAGNQRQPQGNQGGGMMQTPGHTSPPRTVAEAKTMRAEAMGLPAPEISQEDYFTPIQAQTSPAGLLDDQASPAAVQQANTPIEAPATSPEIPTVQPTAQAAAQADPGIDPALSDFSQQGLLAAPGGGQNPDAMALFGLLAQYGDPMEAAKGYINYQQGQQRLALQQNQQRSGGFNIIWDKDNKGWFPHRDPVTGRTQLNPAQNAQGQQIERDPEMALREVAGGLYGFDTRGTGAGTGRQLLTPEQIARGEIEGDFYINQNDARRALPRIEDKTSYAVNLIRGLTEHRATDIMTTPVIGDIASIAAEIPGIRAIGGIGDWKSRQDQLRDQSFINAITSIKQDAGGIGPISDRESAALTGSMIRAQRATGREDFDSAMADLEKSLTLILEEARRASGYDRFTPTTETGVDLRTESEQNRDRARAENVDLNDDDQALVNQYLTPQGGQ